MSYKFCSMCGKLFNEEGPVDPLSLLLPDVSLLSQAVAVKFAHKFILPMSGLEVEIVYPKSFKGGLE